MSQEHFNWDVDFVSPFTIKCITVYVSDFMFKLQVFNQDFIYIFSTIGDMCHITTVSGLLWSSLYFRTLLLQYVLLYLHSFPFLQQIWPVCCAFFCRCRNVSFFWDQLEMTLYFDRFIFDSLMRFFLTATKNFKESPFVLGHGPLIGCIQFFIIIIIFIIIM